MKIAIVVHQFLPRHTTGTELYAHAIATRLVAAGHAVEVFSGEDDDTSYLGESDYTHDSLVVRRFSRHASTEAAPHVAAWSSTLAESAFGRFLDAFEPDVIHVFHLFRLGGRILDAAYVRGIPYVVHLMDYWFLCPRMQMLHRDGDLCAGPEGAERCARCAAEGDGDYRALVDALDQGARPEGFDAIEARWPFLRERLERAATVVAPSAYLADRFAAQGLDRARMDVLRYGLDHDRFAARAAREDAVVRFGFVGNLATYKGAHLVLEAFHGLDAPDARLDVFGDFFFHEDDHVARCNAWIRSDDRITLRGRFDHHELPSVLAGLDAVVVPSLWHENAPFVVLEALQAGCPVVASDVGGIAEIVRDGVDGFLFRRGDVEDLAKRLAAVLEDFATERSGGTRRLRPPAEPISTLDANVAWLLDRYAAVIAEERAPDPAVVARLDRGFRERMHAAVRFLVEPLQAATDGDRDVLTRLQAAADTARDLAAHRATLAELRETEATTRREFAGVEAALRDEIAAGKDAMGTLQTDLEGHRASLAEVRAEIDGYRDVVSRLTAENETLKAHSATIEADLDGHRKALADQREIAASAGQLANQLADRAGEVESLRDERDALAAELERLRRDAEDARATAEEQQRYLNCTRRRLRDLARAIDRAAPGPNL